MNDDEQVEEIFADEEEVKLSTLGFKDAFIYYVNIIRLTGLTVLEVYGWYALLIGVLIYFLWRKYKHQLVNLNQSEQTNELLKKYDQNELYERQERMLQTRLKMQEQQNRLSEEHLAKMKQKEEEIRQRKINEWQQFVDGKGYHNKAHVEENQTTSTTTTKKPKKPSLRPDDYNPLMGHGGTGGYRPSRRGCGPGSGGG